MSVDARETERPLYEREVAPVDGVGDLVLLVLTTADEDVLAFDQLVPRVVTLVEDADAFPAVETDTAGVAALDALGMFASLDYVEEHPHSPMVETAQLTERGERAAEALVSGLEPQAQAALTEVITRE